MAVAAQTRPSNASGQSQAAAAGRATAHLLGETPARLVTSSLTRAVETGAAVAEATGLTAEVDPDWDEQDFGDWDGVAVADLMRDEPEALQALRMDPRYARPGGETHEQMAERVLAAFERCVAAGGTTVVVCHRKPIMTVLAHLLRMPHETIWRLAAAPGSLTAIEVWPDGNASVAFTNRTCRRRGAQPSRTCTTTGWSALLAKPPRFQRGVLGLHPVGAVVGADAEHVLSGRRLERCAEPAPRPAVLLRPEVGVRPRSAVVGADLDAHHGSPPGPGPPREVTGPGRRMRTRVMKSGSPGRHQQRPGLDPRHGLAGLAAALPDPVGSRSGTRRTRGR